MSILLALSLVLGILLYALALRTDEQRDSAPPLPSPSRDLGTVTVLLPVRDERENILPCLDRLLAQTARPRVRVVDDGSTDGTGALLAERAAHEPRLEILEAGDLPAGWPGKVHALWAGWRGIATPWVLLTDADTRHEPELLARALAAAGQEKLDAVSVAGTQEVRGPGESLLTGGVFALLDILLGDWRAAASGSGPAVANGQFILLRREAWDACGGFETVRGAPIDDVAIAGRLREQGFRTAFFRTPELRVRMYRGGGETWRGWRRNLGALFGHQPGLVTKAVALLAVPALVLAGLLLSGRWVEAAVLWSAGAAASALLRSGTGSPAWGLLYPLDALLLCAVLVLGTVDRRRGRLARWKGREVQV